MKEDKKLKKKHRTLKVLLLLSRD